MNEELPTQTQEQINEFLGKGELKGAWIYTLWNGEAEADGGNELECFENAEQITIKRFINKNNDWLYESIIINAEELKSTIHEYFEKKQAELKALEDD